MEERQEPRIDGLEALRAPERSPSERRRLEQRVVAAAAPLLARRRRAAPWETLEVWARPGLVAAAAALALLIGAVRFAAPQPEPALAPVALEEVLRPDEGADVPSWLLDTREPDATVMLESALRPPPPPVGR